MKNINFNYQITTLIFSLFLIVSCSERNLDTLAYATNYPTTPEVFIDGFSAGLDYAAWGKVTNFKVVYDVKYSGNAAMRFEVPDAGDPFGTSAGGVFQTSMPRDLSGYTVLTFWAKASEPDTLSSIGFGQSSTKGVDDATYKITLDKLVLTTAWTKYYIPIPDPSKLTHEKGMFWYWVDPRKGGKGFTFWIDEMKYENLGTIAHPSTTVFSGKDVVYNNVETGDYQISNLSGTFNLPTGINQTETLTSAYLTLTSSNPSVATADKPGKYTVINAGSTLITAKLAGNQVQGSALIYSIGAPILPATSAPTPTIASANVVSIFSDKYANSTVDTFDPFWTWTGGGMTTAFSTLITDGNKYLRYSNFNDTYSQKKVLVAISFESIPINVSAMTYFHMDVWVPATSPNLTNKPSISLEDWGANYGGTSSTGKYTHSTALPTNQWVSLEIPFTSFTGLTSRSHLVHIVLDDFPTVIYVDNVYFHN